MMNTAKEHAKVLTGAIWDSVVYNKGSIYDLVFDALSPLYAERDALKEERAGIDKVVSDQGSINKLYVSEMTRAWSGQLEPPEEPHDLPQG